MLSNDARFLHKTYTRYNRNPSVAVHSQPSRESEATSARIVRGPAARGGPPPAEPSPPAHRVVDVVAANSVLAAAGNRPPPVAAGFPFARRGHDVCEGVERASVEPGEERVDGRTDR